MSGKSIFGISEGIRKQKLTAVSEYSKRLRPTVKRTINETRKIEEIEEKLKLRNERTKLLINQLNKVEATGIRMSYIPSYLLEGEVSETSFFVVDIENDNHEGPKSVNDPKMMSNPMQRPLCSAYGIYKETGKYGRIKFPPGIAIIRPIQIKNIVNILKAVCKCGSKLIFDKREAISAGTGYEGLNKLAAVLKVKNRAVCGSHIDPQTGKEFQCLGYVDYKVKSTYESGVVTYDDDNKKLNTISHKPGEISVQSILENIHEETYEILGIKKEAALSSILTALLVSPPSTRSGYFDGNKENESKPTTAYRAIVTARNKLGEAIFLNQKYKSKTGVTRTKGVIKAEHGNVGDKTQDLYNKIKELEDVEKTIWDGKKGKFMTTMLAKRTSDSGRATLEQYNTKSPFIAIGDVSFRAVETVGVPSSMTKNLTKKYIVTAANYVETIYLAKFGKILTVEKRQKYGKGSWNTILCSEGGEYQISIGDIVSRELRNGDIIIHTRQPLIEKGGMGASYAVIIEDNTIRYPFLICGPQHADFDGDEVNLTVVQSEEALAEAWIRIMFGSKMMSSKTGSPNVKATLNALDGWLEITKKETKISVKFLYETIYENNYNFPTDAYDWKKRLEFRGISIFSGKALFSLLLPPDFNYPHNIISKPTTSGIKIVNGILLEGQIKSSDIKKIFHKLIINYAGTIIPKDFIANVHFVANNFMDKFAMSIGWNDIAYGSAKVKSGESLYEAVKRKTNEADMEIKMLERPKNNYEKMKYEQNIRAIIYNTQNDISKLSTSILNEGGNRIMQMIESGSKGGQSNIFQVGTMVGQADIKSKIPTPYLEDGRILSTGTRGMASLKEMGFSSFSFHEGIDPYNQFIQAMAARLSGIVKALDVPTTGDAQKKLTRLLSNVITSGGSAMLNGGGMIFQAIAGGSGLNVENTIKVNDIVTFADLSDIASTLNSQFGYVPSYTGTKINLGTAEQLGNLLGVPELAKRDKFVLDVIKNISLNVEDIVLGVDINENEIKKVIDRLFPEYGIKKCQGCEYSFDDMKKMPKYSSIKQKIIYLIEEFLPNGLNEYIIDKMVYLEKDIVDNIVKEAHELTKFDEDVLYLIFGELNGETTTNSELRKRGASLTDTINLKGEASRYMNGITNNLFEVIDQISEKTAVSKKVIFNFVTQISYKDNFQIAEISVNHITQKIYLDIGNKYNKSIQYIKGNFVLIENDNNPTIENYSKNNIIDSVKSVFSELRLIERDGLYHEYDFDKIKDKKYDYMYGTVEEFEEVSDTVYPVNPTLISAFSEKYINEFIEKMNLPDEITNINLYEIIIDLLDNTYIDNFMNIILWKDAVPKKRTSSDLRMATILMIKNVLINIAFGSIITGKNKKPKESKIYKKYYYNERFNISDLKFVPENEFFDALNAIVDKKHIKIDSLPEEYIERAKIGYKKYLGKFDVDILVNSLNYVSENLKLTEDERNSLAESYINTVYDDDDMTMKEYLDIYPDLSWEKVDSIPEHLREEYIDLLVQKYSITKSSIYNVPDNYQNEVYKLLSDVGDKGFYDAIYNVDFDLFNTFDEAEYYLLNIDDEYYAQALDILLDKFNITIDNINVISNDQLRLDSIYLLNNL